MSNKIQPPFPLFSDINGLPLDEGFIYIGETGKDPEVYPVPVFWDENLTIPAEQPVRTHNGYLSNYGVNGKLYISNDECSITVLNKNGTLIHADLYADLVITQRNLAEKLRKLTVNVESIAELLELDRWEGRTVYVKGYHSPQNFTLTQPYIGGGTRLYVASRAHENDGFLCIDGWVLQIENNTVMPEQAGALGDNETDDTIPLQKTFASGFLVECNQYANYKISKPLEIFDKQKIIGNGATITKYGNSKTGITGKVDPNGNSYNYDIDCVLVLAASFGYSKGLNISGLTLIKEQVEGEDVGYNLFVPYISLSKFEDMVVQGGSINVYSEDAWMIEWTKVRAQSADINFRIKTGTTNTFHKCWAVGAREIGYALTNLVYSTIINSTVEYAGTDGKPIEACYLLSKGNISLISCGCENVHAKAIVATDEGAQVTVIDPTFIMITNNYPNGYYGGGLLTSRHPDDCLRVYGGVMTAKNGSTPAYAITTHAASYIEIHSLKAEGMQKHYSNLAYRPSFSQHTRGSIRYYGDGEFYNFASYNDALQGLTTLNGSRTTKASLLEHGDTSTGTIANGFPADGFAGYFLNFSNGNTTILENNSAQLALGFNQNVLAYRRAEWGGNYGAWIHALTKVNTTVDTNGFIKAASPIVKLFSDHVECNDEAAEQQIIFEKVNVGHYLIKGSSGFAKEGWWIEVPMDTYGNKICAVESQLLENGDIEVKTFKRKFDIATASIVADEDNPIDIPCNINGEQRWIDLRLRELQKSELVN